MPEVSQPQPNPRPADQPVQAATSDAPAPAANAPQQQLAVNSGHYKNGRITRAGMVHVIRGGGTVVLHEPVIAKSGDYAGQVVGAAKTRHIRRIEDIPSEAELAESPEEKAAARRQLQAERERLDKQIADLGDDEKSEAAKPAKK